MLPEHLAEAIAKSFEPTLNRRLVDRKTADAAWGPGFVPYKCFDFSLASVSSCVKCVSWP